MPVESRLRGISGEWTFDADVADHFDEMLDRSIPGYTTMREIVSRVGLSFMTADATVLDLGCSHGAALAPFVAEPCPDAFFVGVDVSEPMLALARDRFRGDPRVTIDALDLRVRYPSITASLTLLCLTLMFTPIQHRARILRNVVTHTVPGGALILVEKVLGATDRTDRLLVSEYHDLKARNGYSREEIDRKALALEGVQVPLTARWNEEALATAGFVDVDCIWRHLNFAAWIAIVP